MSVLIIYFLFMGTVALYPAWNQISGFSDSDFENFPQSATSGDHSAQPSRDFSWNRGYYVRSNMAVALFKGE